MRTSAEKQKPSYEEWLYWSQVVIDRLRDIVRVYTHPPFEDVFIPENEKQFKMAQTVDTLRQFHMATEDDDSPRRLPDEIQSEQDERTIDVLRALFRDVQRRLAPLSSDMQKILKSPWHSNCTGKLATQLFCGPEGRENEGIGSGHIEHGRLPSVIETLLEREKMGDDRPARQIASPKGAGQMQREDIAKRWARQNGAFLRTAGRMD